MRLYGQLRHMVLYTLSTVSVNTPPQLKFITPVSGPVIKTSLATHTVHVVSVDIFAVFLVMSPTLLIAI